METKKAALLVMDMQMGFLQGMPEQGKSIVMKISEAIRTAREKNLMIIFVRLGFHRGLPEVSPSNKMFYGLKNHLTDTTLESFMQIHPGLGMTAEDIVINKKRVSAFSGNDLEMLLRAQSISHLILTGISTSGMVLATFWDAFDKDYQLTILSDACADPDAEMHELLTGKLLPKYAGVVTIDQWKIIADF
jgi:nicotinamidase-related amidase